MGGGDLNSKKSWHPYTQKNMEKVWKAEQQNNEEKRRIAELRREIEMERDKEEITEYAMQQGIIDKKDNKKLDWMYKGPNSTIDREEYLLGKRIDKSFEESLQTAKDSESNKVSKNHVEHECIPPSLRNFVGTDQVDLARKLQEDPLNAIKKKEIESRAQLLKNPLKLKQLKGMLENDRKTSKKKAEKSKKQSLDDKLDVLLANKYKKLKNEISAKDLIKQLKNKKNKKKKGKKHRKDSSSSSNSTSESSDSDSSSNSDDDAPEKKKRKARSPLPRDQISKRSQHNDKEKYEKRKEKRERDRRRSRSRSKSRSRSRSRSKTRSEVYNEKSSKYKNYGLMKADGTKITPKKCYSPLKDNSVKHVKKEEKKYIPAKREKLSDEEKQRRLKEMAKDAELRNKERSKKVRQYYKEEEKERSQMSFSKDFIRNELAKAVTSSSVESRIKANLNNIQRSKYAMNSNFARR